MQKEGKKPSWLNRNILNIGLVSLFTDTSTEMAYPLIPVFLKEVLKVEPLFIGIVEAIAESTASTLKTFSGYLSDRFGKRKLFLFIGYTFSAIVKPLLAFATAGWHVLAVRFADRFGKGIRNAPRDALIADSTDKTCFGRAFGFHRALDTFGAALGPLLAFIVLALTRGNYRLLFGLAFIPGLVAVVFIIFGVREIAPTAKRVFRFSFKDFSPQLKKFMVIMAIFTLGNSSDAFLILRAKDIGISTVAVPLLWLAFNVSYFLWSYPAGTISDHIGRKRTLFLGFLVFSLCYAAMSFNTSVFWVWIIFVIYGLYYGFTEGNFRAFIADLTPAEARGTVFGVYHTVIGLTLLPANLLVGFVWQKWGFNIALLIGASLSLISAILMLILLRPSKQTS